MIKSQTRKLELAPSFAHYHVWCRYPSGLRSIGVFWDPEKAKEWRDSQREMERNGFPYYVAWCTAPTGLTGQCWPHDERPE